MKLLIEYANIIVETPADVLKHTKQYLDRENVMHKFLEEKVELTNNKKDYIKRTDLYKEYAAYCKENNINAMRSEIAYDDFHLYLDPELFKEKSNGLTNIWRCYKFKEIYEIEDELDVYI